MHTFSHHGFLDKPRKPVFKLIAIKSDRLEAEVRFLKLLSARLVFYYRDSFLYKEVDRPGRAGNEGLDGCHICFRIRDS